jgi:hypothetical protein
VTTPKVFAFETDNWDMVSQTETGAPLTNTRFQTEPPDSVYNSAPGSAHTGGSDSPDLLPFFEAVFLGLHFRDYLTENEQARFRQFAPPSGYLVVTLGERVLFPDDLPAQVLEGLSPAVLGASDAIFTHRCCIHDRDLAPGVVHSARIGTLESSNLMLSVCQSDPFGERHQQIEKFGQLVATARAAMRTASEVVTILKPRLSAEHPYLIVNRASGRVVTASEGIRRELDSESEQLVDSEYSQAAVRLCDLFQTCATRMENISPADMNLAIVTFLPERRRKTGSGDPADAGRLVEAMRDEITAIVAASCDLRNRTPGNTQDDPVEAISTHAIELTKLIDDFDSGPSVSRSGSADPAVNPTRLESRLQNVLLRERS